MPYPPQAYQLGEMSGTSATAREPQVHQSIASLEATANELCTVVQELTQRLGVVLQPEGPEKQSNAVSAARSIKVPLAERVDQVAMQIDFNRSRLRDLLQRLEV